MHLGLIVYALSAVSPAWSIEAELYRFDQAAASAFEARVSPTGSTENFPGSFDESFAHACLLDDEAYWLRASYYLPSVDEPITDRIETMRDQLVSLLEMDDPPGTVFAASGYRYPQSADTIDQALIARAQYDQLIRVFHSEFLVSDDDQWLEAIISLDLVCETGRRNADFLYQLVLNEGFPSHQSYGFPAENAAFLMAKHITDEGKLALVTAAAGYAAGANRVSRTNFGYLLDWLAITAADRQFFGTYVRCENGEAVSDPAVINSQAADFWREELSVPDRQELNRLACPNASE